jgi:hypothetical protein
MAPLFAVRGEFLFANAKFRRFGRDPGANRYWRHMPRCRKKRPQQMAEAQIGRALRTLALAKRREECVSIRRVAAWLS